MRKKHVVVLLLLVVTFGAGFLTVNDPFFQIRKNFTIFSEVLSEVNELYVVEVDPERTIRRGINAMLETLDPYTVLIDESQTGDIDIMTTGSYAGVGIEVGARRGELVVIAPIDGYSAQREGVRAGDVIVRVNGIDASEFNPDDLNSQLRGQPGTEVEFVVRRFGIDEELLFTLTRERIEIKNVEWYGFADSDKTIGYIQLSRFAQNAGAEVRAAIESLSEQRGEELDGLILDLRNNPGGLLIEAVRIADLFLPRDKMVVRTDGRMRQARQQYRTESPSFFKDKPVVVLQNSGSASSSEIVSGALQDHDRAVVIGERSFGKGLVQIIRPISYGLALKITTSKYFIPSGRYIQAVDYQADELIDSEEIFKTSAGREVMQRNGIDPDILLDGRPSNMLEVALLRGNHYFFFANQYVAEATEMPQPGIDDDALIRRFQQYLEREEFTYRSRSERLLTELEEQLLADLGERSSSAAAPLEDLRTQIREKQRLEMDSSRDVVLRELYSEIGSRFSDEAGQTRALRLQLDPAVKRALDVIMEQEYNQLLSP
ncbi:MAG: S41 family peptidase [Balneolales bacterium]|nr:S41 family peptidase [Balneolales bacterium]